MVDTVYHTINIHTVYQAINKFVCFLLDIKIKQTQHKHAEKLFGRVPRGVLLRVMQKLGVQEWLNNLVLRCKVHGK